jgi:RNA polymerase sigma factor (sigma-70 family)
MGESPIWAQRGWPSARRVDRAALGNDSSGSAANVIVDNRQRTAELLDHAHAAVRQSRIAMLLEHRRRILSRIRLLLRNEDDALDLLQDVCIAALISPIDFEDKDHFLRWCGGVAQRTALQSYRHSLRRARLEAEVGETCRGSGFEPVADPEARASRLQLVFRSIAAIDVKSFELVLARYVDRASARELADGSEQSPAAMRVKLSRIRATMRRALR